MEPLIYDDTPPVTENVLLSSSCYNFKLALPKKETIELKGTRMKCEASSDVEEWKPNLCPKVCRAHGIQLNLKVKHQKDHNIHESDIKNDILANNKEVGITLLGNGVPHRKQKILAVVLSTTSCLYVLPPRKSTGKLLHKLANDSSITKYTTVLPWTNDALFHKWKVDLCNNVEDASIRHNFIHKQFERMCKTQQAHYPNFGKLESVSHTKSYDDLVARYFRVERHDIYCDESQLHHLNCRPLCLTAKNIIMKRTIFLIPLAKAIKCESEKGLVNIHRVFRDYLRILPESYSFLFSRNAIDYVDLHSHIAFGPIYKPQIGEIGDLADDEFIEDFFSAGESESEVTSETSDSALCSSAPSSPTPNSFDDIELVEYSDIAKSRRIYNLLYRLGEVGISMLGPKRANRNDPIKMIMLSTPENIFALSLSVKGHPLLTSVSRSKNITKYTTNLMQMSDCLYAQFRVVLDEPLFDAQAVHTHHCLDTKPMQVFEKCVSARLYRHDDIRLETHEALIGEYMEDDYARQFAKSMIPNFEVTKAGRLNEYIDSDLAILDTRPLSGDAKLLIFKRSVFVMPLCKRVRDKLNSVHDQIKENARTSIMKIACDKEFKKTLDKYLDSYGKTKIRNY